jgi:hypothetical protein
MLADGLVERDADEDAARGAGQLGDGADVADRAAAGVGGDGEEAGATAGLDFCDRCQIWRFF